MNSLLANPDTATLIQGLKPHLGQRGTALADGMLAVINFATSNMGKDMLRIVAQISPTGDQKGKSYNLQTADGPFNIPFNLPFVMFLIFILLTFSENPMLSGSGYKQKKQPIINK